MPKISFSPKKTIFPVDTGRKLHVQRRSEDVLAVFWTSYVRSIYVLCLRVSRWEFVRWTTAMAIGSLFKILLCFVSIYFCLILSWNHSCNNIRFKKQFETVTVCKNFSVKSQSNETVINSFMTKAPTIQKPVYSILNNELNNVQEIFI